MAEYPELSNTSPPPHYQRDQRPTERKRTLQEKEEEEKYKAYVEKIQKLPLFRLPEHSAEKKINEFLGAQELATIGPLNKLDRERKNELLMELKPLLYTYIDIIWDESTHREANRNHQNKHLKSLLPTLSRQRPETLMRLLQSCSKEQLEHTTFDLIKSEGDKKFNSTSLIPKKCLKNFIRNHITHQELRELINHITLFLRGFNDPDIGTSDSIEEFITKKRKYTLLEKEVLKRGGIRRTFHIYYDVNVMTTKTFLLNPNKTIEEFKEIHNIPVNSSINFVGLNLRNDEVITEREKGFNIIGGDISMGIFIRADSEEEYREILNNINYIDTSLLSGGEEE